MFQRAIHIKVLANGKDDKLILISVKEMKEIAVSTKRIVARSVPVRRRSCTLDYVAGKSFIKITRPTHAGYYYYEVHSAGRVLRCNHVARKASYTRTRARLRDRHVKTRIHSRAHCTAR